jgi:uncharacterized cupin superfamily protein
MGNSFFRLLPEGDPVSGLQPVAEVAQEDFTTEDRSEIEHIFFTSDDKGTWTGVWECAPCIEDIDSYPVNEMMTVISGSVTLTNENGESETFTSGDTFFLTKGAKIRWQITEKLRKFYMITS